MTSKEQTFLVKAIEYMYYCGKSSAATEGMSHLVVINAESGKRFFINMFPEFKEKTDDEIFFMIEEFAEKCKNEEKERIKKEYKETEREYKQLMRKVRLEKFIDTIFG